ncbi:MAG: UvrD-helicase domain-containing protein [Clostridiales bacterium]|jgi:uncharacterized protein (TIGR00375 family)|nr:UvrD-helicase domain-containing protein [Clostridiales bacterium]
MYIADLHIHSKYSRATSRECIPEYLDLWARRKGIALIGTGDFTHPAWREELKQKLIPAEEGLYRLREDARISEETQAGQAQTRFVVTGEISSIYKKNGKVRKVHNLILLPGLEEAEELSRRLEAIGNIHSDGRPILGLDSRDLLEITLESCPKAVFVPAHIWTPHFSLFGAFSGFDSIEECFEDLTPHIHALETGLSSDPPMNWRVSALDRYHLISNSDAHSPSKLGREANLLETQLSYPALSQALQEGQNGGLAGTIEFFPEEGKYHYDGHRNCKQCLTPAETERLGGKCPVCGKKITIGVQHRVEQLADRGEGYVPENASSFESLVPLPEVIAASTGRSPASVKVNAQYETMLKELGSEFYILRQASLDDIRKSAGPCVEEGIRRLRAGQVERQPGYDGEYGVIHLLDPSERESLSGQTCLFGVSKPKKKKTAAKPQGQALKKQDVLDDDAEICPQPVGLLAQLNPEQRQAVTTTQPVVAVVAGPGTGKTKTLITRIAYLVDQCGVKPSEITAVTFTNKAAKELKERLEQQFGPRAIRSMNIGTFHSICMHQGLEAGEKITLLDENSARELAQEVLRELDIKQSPSKFLRELSRKKCGFQQAELSENACERYQEKLRQTGAMDFDDLLINALRLWTEKPDDKQKRRFTHLLVDEFQDINDLQYQLIAAWSRESQGLFVIGDPDQSIYGFRGSDSRCFDRLKEDCPSVQEIRLRNNYRSTPEILGCALPVISKNPGGERLLQAQRPKGAPVSLVSAPSDLSEAIAVAKEINRMVGGIDMLDAQASSQRQERESPRSFSEIAVLYRTHRQAELLEKCLRRESIPYVVSGRDDLLSDPLVKGAVGFFRFLLDSGDILSLRAGLSAPGNIPSDLAESFGAAWRSLDSSSPWEERILKMERAFGDVEPLRIFLKQLSDYRPRVRKEKPGKLIENWAKENDLMPNDNLERFLNMSVFHPTMSDFLENLLTGQEGDIVRSAGKRYLSNAVTLMTLHGSKGLEFPVVFLCGVKKGWIPLEQPGRSADLEEERRLFYVGMTRAKEELFLMTSSEPSSFLTDVPKEYVHQTTSGVSQPVTGKQLSFF